MTKSTALVLALALLASLFIATSPVQAAPIPSSPSSSPPQHTKRDGALGPFAPLITALGPFTTLAGQGLQGESAQAAGAIQDAGASIKKQTDRAGDMTQESLSGAGEAIVDSPSTLTGVAKAAPV
ncbi:hypothetical protein K457DRAFT_127930 [Linnemannia elongata AG-77]|uniref:Uncharacterized protein n=1 Tax=Linnemannia elongata AG-77 TaxID=1314771 RepID=A0A197JP26_9FUNG|nr:hypothetical protein K457DRAFT_127930 [Linnemannia elongata AG-77]